MHGVGRRALPALRRRLRHCAARHGDRHHLHEEQKVLPASKAPSDPVIRFSLEHRYMRIIEGKEPEDLNSCGLESEEDEEFEEVSTLAIGGKKIKLKNQKNGLLVY